ncbi:MAG: transporter substrate-binding domain-containing protein [Acetobacter sp.]
MKRRSFLASALATSTLGRKAYAKSRILVLGTDVELKPFDFPQGGRYVGFDQDVFSEIARDLSVSYTVTPMDFGALMPALQTASIDAAISSIAITPERARAVDFSDPYYISTLGVLVRADNASIFTSSDLRKKSVAAITGTAGARWLKEHMPEADVTLFPQTSSMYLELQINRVDAIVHDKPNLAYYARTKGKGAVRLLMQPIGDPIPCGIAFPKGSPLRAPTNAALKAIRADGRYDKLNMAWFGQVPV